jgi:small GTP-binding protein
MSEDIESFKVVLVGESGVGKTSIITQFIEQTFQEDQQSTTGGTFSTKSVICDNNKTLKFEIWDTAGQERYRSLTKMFYKDANAAVLVYDITRKDSFEELKSYWAEQIKESTPPNIIIVIVANKADLLEQETVNEEEARKFAGDMGALFVSTSAKTMETINQLFIEIAKKYTGSTNVKIKEEEEEAEPEEPQEHKDSVRLSKQNNSKKKKKKFC